MSIDLASVFQGSQQTFIIAEIAQAHDGNFNFAHSFIDLAGDSGADAVKFQTHFADEESTLAEPWRIKFSHLDSRRFDYWKRMEFSTEQWLSLKEHAEKRGLVFMSSPFSLKAVDLLASLKMKVWKVPSGEISNQRLLAEIAAHSEFAILSSGMSSWAELDEAVSIFRDANRKLAVLQCTTNYPCPPERWGLHLMSQISSRYNCVSGLSDHSSTPVSALAAVALGAKIVEVHLAFDKTMFGPDSSSSLTGAELKYLVEGARKIETALKNLFDKDQMAESLGDLRRTFQKNIVADRDLQAGAVLSAGDIALRKAGGGLGPRDYSRVLGRKLKCSISRNHAILEEHLS